MRRVALGLLLLTALSCASASPGDEPDVTLEGGGEGGEGSSEGGAAGGPDGGGGKKGGSIGFPGASGQGGAKGGKGGKGGSSAGGASGGASGGGEPGGGEPGGSEQGGSAGEEQAGSGQAGASTECTPGETEVVGACAKCGQQKRTCNAQGSWGAPSCQGQGECEAGQTDSQDCGNCGSQTRTCSNACQWGGFGTCGGQGECKPGDEQPGGCDPCEHKTCSASCSWSACKLKATSQCAWEDGKNFQCCGGGKWQFCSKTTCDWFPCAACSGCGC